MAISVTIAGIDQTHHIERLELSVDKALGQRATATVSFVDPTNTVRPALDDAIWIKAADGTTTIFFGLVARVEETPLGRDTGLRRRLECVSADAYADRRLVTGEWAAGETLYSITSTLQQTYLQDYGVNLSILQGGSTIALDALSYDHRPLTEVYNELSVLTGWQWGIASDAVGTPWFLMAPGADSSAPATITDADTNCLEFAYETARDEYRNRQFVKIGGFGQDAKADISTADGATRVYALDYPIVAAPGTITVTSTDPTVYPLGTYGVDTMEWTYASSINSLVQSTDYTILSSGTLVEADYTAKFPLTLQSDSSSEQSTAGVYEHLVEAPDVFDKDAGQAIADGLIRRYAKKPVVIRFTTAEQGWALGQKVTVNLTNRGLDSTYVVTRLRASYLADSVLRWEVEAVEGSEQLSSWLDLYRGWSGTGQTLSGTPVTIPPPSLEGVALLGTANPFTNYQDITRPADWTAIRTFVEGDTEPRWRISQGGKQEWGAGGASTADTNLYRDSTGVLKTDDALIVADKLTVGTTGDGSKKFVVGGNFVSDGNSNVAYSNHFYGTLTGAAGDTSKIVGSVFGNTMVTQTSTEVVTLAAQAYFLEPGITKNVTTINTAANVYIDGAPTEGATNYALFSASGKNFLGGETITDGGIHIGGSSEAGTDNLCVDGTLTAANSKGLGWFDVQAYGAVGDDVTDDAAAIAAALAAIPATGGVLYFPPAVYKHTTTLDFTHTGIRVVGYGAVLHYTGAGTCVQMLTVNPFNYYDLGMEGLTIRGNASATIGLVLDRVNHGTFKDLCVQDVTTTGFQIGPAVCNRFENLRVSHNERVPLVETVTGIDVVEVATANTFINPIIEGVSGTGIRITNGADNTFVGGTSEGNATGVEVLTGSNNTFIGLDCEANTVNDYVLDYSLTTLIGCLGSSPDIVNLLIANAYQASVLNSQFQNVEIQNTAYAAALHNVGYSMASSSGAFTDNGNDTNLLNVYDLWTPGKVANVLSVPAALLTGSTMSTTVTQSSLTKVGTLTDGVWNAGAITAPTVTVSSTAINPLTLTNATTDAGAVAANIIRFKTEASNRYDLGVSFAAYDGAFGLYNHASSAIGWGLSKTNVLTLGGPLVVDSDTSSARDALTPAAGMIVLNSETGQLNFYTGAAWHVLASSAA